MIEETVIHAIKSRVESHRDEIVQFMRDLCAIPSYDSKIRDVGERAATEMKKLGFDWDAVRKINPRIVYASISAKAISRAGARSPDATIS